MPSLFEKGPEILEGKMKMWKVYDDNEIKNANEDDGQKHTWAFGSGELKKKQSKRYVSAV